MRRAPCVALLALLGPLSAWGAAAPGGIKSVRVSRTNDVAEVEIRLYCAVRIASPAGVAEGSRLDLALTPVDRCLEEAGALEYATRPEGRGLAALEAIEYRTGRGAAATLGLVFDRRVQARPGQTGDLHVVTIQVRVPPGSPPLGAPAMLPAAPQAGTVAAPNTLSAEQLARVEERAQRAAMGAPPPPGKATTPGYVVNLRTAATPLDIPAELPGGKPAGAQLYVADVAVDGQVWHQLRLGYFATEAEADRQLQVVRSAYPDAWVARIAAGEQAAAATAATIAATTSAAAGSSDLDATQAAALMGQARGAIVDGNFAEAAALASQVLQGRPPAEVAEARELLGLAYERQGQGAAAMAEYRRYLADYPGSAGAGRVQQRLAALETAREQPRDSLRSAATSAGSSDWEVYGGISQYFGLDSTRFGGEAGTVDQAAIFSTADLTVRHTGQRFDFDSRASLAYNHDLSSGDVDYDNQAWIYNLYVDLADRALGLAARLGRQTLRNQGVLGRFDGALLSWQWSPRYRLNALAGYPVYFADENVDTSRTFYGASLDILGLLDMFDLNIFINEQEIDGINDRQAVGAEVRYFGENRSFIALLDYDYGYGELNNVVGQGNWTFANRLTINGRVDLRLAPYLTTETALVGQPATSVQELLLRYSEAEIRQLALDRAGSSGSVAIGASLPLSERFDISLDVTGSSYDSTPASGGVAETPDSGTLVYSYVSLIGNSLFTEGDSHILGARYSGGDNGDSYAVYLDTRYPLTRALRLNPQLLVMRREIAAGDYSELVARPGIGLLYRLGRHWQLEFEGGGEFGRSEQDGGDATNSTGYFLYLGYSADF